MTERLYPDDDPIMEELYRIRAERLAEYGGDWMAMLRDIHAKQEAEKRKGRQYVRFPLKHVEPTTAGSRPNAE